MESKRLIGDDENGGGAPPAVLGHEPSKGSVNLLLGARVNGEGVDPTTKPLNYLFVPVLGELDGGIDGDVETIS